MEDYAGWSFCGKFRNRLLRRRRPAGTAASGADFTPVLRRTFDIFGAPDFTGVRAVSNLPASRTCRELPRAKLLRER